MNEIEEIEGNSSQPADTSKKPRETKEERRKKRKELIVEWQRNTASSAEINLANLLVNRTNTTESTGGIVATSDTLPGEENMEANGGGHQIPDGKREGKDNNIRRIGGGKEIGHHKTSRRRSDPTSMQKLSRKDFPRSDRALMGPRQRKDEVVGWQRNEKSNMEKYHHSLPTLLTEIKGEDVDEPHLTTADPLSPTKKHSPRTTKGTHTVTVPGASSTDHLTPYGSTIEQTAAPSPPPKPPSMRQLHNRASPRMGLERSKGRTPGRRLPEGKEEMAKSSDVGASPGPSATSQSFSRESSIEEDAVGAPTPRTPSRRQLLRRGSPRRGRSKSTTRYSSRRLLDVKDDELAKTLHVSSSPSTQEQSSRKLSMDEQPLPPPPPSVEVVGGGVGSPTPKTPSRRQLIQRGSPRIGIEPARSRRTLIDPKEEIMNEETIPSPTKRSLGAFISRSNRVDRGALLEVARRLSTQKRYEEDKREAIGMMRGRRYRSGGGIPTATPPSGSNTQPRNPARRKQLSSNSEVQMTWQR